MGSDKLNVLVSYSHEDKEWLERVQVHLKPLARDGKLELWDDTRIKSGQRWRNEIKAALAQADVAILLISADFYASDFIANNELPPLLESAQSERGLVILGVHISYSDFGNDRILSEYQTVNTSKQPIEDLFLTDGACMASCACLNPSITSMAITARAAAHTVEAILRGEI